MTCIVGFIDKDRGKIWMGGDSAGSNSRHVQLRKDVKVFKRKSGDCEFLFGYTSSFRMGQLLRYQLKIPQLKQKELFKYMVTDFIEAVRKCLKDYGYSRVDNNEEHGGNFLVAVKGRLFEIGSDFQVEEVFENYNAVGSGYEYALGALYAQALEPQEEEDVIGILTEALDAASHFNPFVRKPYVFETIEIKGK